tara:strand:- start:155 stop:427 length:273 start_codon:yes stop_codon:yes gene_type:complete
MFIRLLKAIVELVYVSVRLAYVFVFYPSSIPTKRAEKVLDPQYDGDEYGSGETGEALKDEWIQGNIVTKETDYTFDPIVVESTKKILKES